MFSPHLLSLRHAHKSSAHKFCTMFIFMYISSIGAFIHKKDRDFHRDWNTEIFLGLFRQVEISRWSPSGMILVTELRMPDIKHILPLFWYARLEWWDRKYQDYLLKRLHIRRDANNCAYSQIIASRVLNLTTRENIYLRSGRMNVIANAICSAMLIAIISEIFMSTLVKISRYRSRWKKKPGFVSRLFPQVWMPLIC